MVTQLYRQDEITCEDVSALISNPISYNTDFVLLQPGGTSDKILFDDIGFHIVLDAPADRFYHFQVSFQVQKADGRIHARILTNNFTKNIGQSSTIKIFFQPYQPFLFETTPQIIRTIAAPTNHFKIASNDLLVLKFIEIEPSDTIPIVQAPHLYYRRVTRSL